MLSGQAKSGTSESAITGVDGKPAVAGTVSGVI